MRKPCRNDHGRRSLPEEIADLREEFHIGRNLWGGGRRLLLLESLELLNHQKNAESNDEEVNNRLNEHPIGNGGAAYRDRKAGEIDFPKQ